MRLVMPRLYVILDAERMTGSAAAIAQQLIDAGVRLFQYRSKGGSAREIFKASCTLARMATDAGATFFVNDRPDIAYLAGASGVHVGQTDLSVDQTRVVIGSDKWIGVSTHNEPQFRAALETSADYVAVGPIFATKSKQDPDPVVGTELIRRMRPWTTKPIVAIGGITLDRASEVIDAGADSVAVISDILRAKNPAQRANEFLRVLAS